MWDLPRGKKAPREVKGTFLVPQELGGEWMGGEVSPWAEGHPPTPDSNNPQVHLHGTPTHLYPQAWPVQPSLPGALPSTHLPWIKALPWGAAEGRSSPH